ncbi:MAG: carboxymuconolactone decarboxylase family protein [Acidimicrobiia bacterium]
MGEEGDGTAGGNGWPFDPAWEATYRRVLGTTPSQATPFLEVAAETVHRIWGRPGLSIRDRRLIVLSVLAVSGAPRQLREHLVEALRSGDLTAVELDELSLQVAMYGGWPQGVNVQATLAEVRAELDLE